MKFSQLPAFQGTLLKTSLQKFWGRNKIKVLFGMLVIIAIPFALIKTVDVSSWLSTESSSASNSIFLGKPDSEQIKILVNRPVRSIKIYPNPISGQLTLSFDKTLENAIVRVYDQSGKSVFESADQDGTMLQLDISEFPKGNYLINVEDNHYNYYSTKFTKKNN